MRAASLALALLLLGAVTGAQDRAGPEIGASEWERRGLAVSALLLCAAGLLLYKRHRELAALRHRLEELSVTDALTGLRNRRWLREAVEADVATSLRRHRAGGDAPREADLVFTLVDVDDFRQINETHGHAVGDELLVQVGRLLRSRCRTSDSLVRWGGEEFLIVSRFVNRDEAGALAERVRRAVAEHEFEIGDGQIARMTCSVGCAPFPFHPEVPDALNWEQVVALADEALAAAKRSGHNAWVGLSSRVAAAAEALGRGAPRELADRIRRGELALDSSLDATGLRWADR